MARKRWMVSTVWLAAGLILLAGLGAMGRESEEQLLQQIQTERNPVKKAKDEIKLASLKLSQAHNAYSQGRIEEGAGLLGTFMDEMKTSWKLLQDSGRTAAKQPEGFRELEMSLRENARLLQDLERTVSYFDRDPLVKAREELEKMRFEVIHELFPEDKSHNHKGPPDPQSNTGPGSSTEAR